MINGIMRYLVVLVIFCATAFVLYQVVQANPSLAGAVSGPRGAFPREGGEGFGTGQGMGRHRDRPSGDLTTEQLQAGARLEGFEGRGRGEGHVDVAAGLMGVLRNLGIIAAITAVIIAIRWLFRRFGGRKPRPTPA